MMLIKLLLIIPAERRVLVKFRAVLDRLAGKIDAYFLIRPAHAVIHSGETINFFPGRQFGVSTTIAEDCSAAGMCLALCYLHRSDRRNCDS